MKNKNIKSVIVTGGTRGLGKSLVDHFLKKGFNVSTCSISKESCSALKAANIHHQDRLYIQQCDISNNSEVQKFVTNVINLFGKIDVLVNNAGIHVPIEKFYNNDPVDWMNTVNVNLNGVFPVSYTHLTLPTNREV